VFIGKLHVWFAFPMHVREGEREREAADVGERSQKGTCAWGDIAFTHSPVVFSS
jgi:hypothetical protein